MSTAAIDHGTTHTQRNRVDLHATLTELLASIAKTPKGEVAIAKLQDAIDAINEAATEAHVDLQRELTPALIRLTRKVVGL